jgi:hypothetical protein
MYGILNQFPACRRWAGRYQGRKYFPEHRKQPRGLVNGKVSKVEVDLGVSVKASGRGRERPLGKQQNHCADQVGGDRPAGIQPPDSMTVQAAWASTKAIGQNPTLREPSSTDSNLEAGHPK